MGPLSSHLTTPFNISFVIFLLKIIYYCWIVPFGTKIALFWFSIDPESKIRPIWRPRGDLYIFIMICLKFILSTADFKMLTRLLNNLTISDHVLFFPFFVVGLLDDIDLASKLIFITMSLYNFLSRRRSDYLRPYIAVYSLLS